MERIRAVCFILYEGGKILVEERKESHVICIPSGHLEPTETKEQALDREVFEELNVRPVKSKYMGECPLTFEGKEYVLFYYLVTSWLGEVVCKEAERIFWLSLDDLSQLSFYENRFMCQGLQYELLS